MKVKSHNISHPPFTCLHFFAAGAKAPKIFSLYTRKRIPKTTEQMRAAMARIFCSKVSFLKVASTLRWTFSADRSTWSLYERFVLWLYGELLLRLAPDEIRRDQGGLLCCSSGEGEPNGDIGSASAFAVEL
jgi:hypothetical protein